MTTLDLLKLQLDESGYQLTKVFEGLTDSVADSRPCEHGMSVRETMLHLSECYEASIKSAQGQEHEWGTYTIEDMSFSNLEAHMHAKRSEAKAAILAADEEKAAHLATSFLVLHDAYHVGQIALVRLGLDPNWNPYSIYNFG